MVKLKSYSFHILGIMILIATLLFFGKLVSYLLDKFLVSTIFSQFESGVWQDLFFVALLIFTAAWVAKMCNLESIIITLSYILTLYIFQRFNGYWQFTKMSLLPEFAYWDLFVFTAFLVLLLYFLFISKVKEIDKSPINSGFIEDSTVENIEDDHFNRNVAATQIATEILNTNNKRSFAIGILGQYGSGKTSFLNLINMALKVEKKVLTISFDPWSAANPEMIRREFFDLLSDQVAAVDPRMSPIVYNYGRKLASFDGRSQSWFNWISFFGNRGSIQSSGEYDQINKMLSNTGRKVVITIDDLDRLYPAEIIEVLKLIRNTGNFSNVFYLVGYDREYLQSAIGILNAKASDYLDKIFQLEIPLPKRGEDDLLITLKSNLKQMVTEAHYAIFENSMIPNGFLSRYEKAYSGILRHGRDVVRFLNNFKIAYKLIGEEVDFECLLLLELIKFRFPSIYDIIYTHADIFLYEISLRTTHEQYYSPALLNKKDSNTPMDEISLFRIHLEKIGIREEDVSLLDGLFITLFKGNQYHKPKAKNSISYPLYFEIYFRYRLAQTDLSEKDYQVAKSSGHMREYMEYCANYGLHKRLMTRFLQEDVFTDRRDFEQMIRFIFSFGPTFVQKESKFRFDYNALIDKIYNYLDVVTEKFYKNDIENYKNFINHLFGIAVPPFLFENELLYHLKKKGEGFVLSVEEMTAHQFSYFTRYAETSHGLSENVLWIFYSAREYHRMPADSSGAYEEHWRFEPTLVAKMKGYLVNKDLTEFLKFSIQREMRETSMFSIVKQVIDMFDDPADYRRIVVENPALEEDIRTEYLEFFDKCAVEEWSKSVPMEFKTALRTSDQNI